ncbi:MAG: hypothetical protein N0A16_12745 [Blastocatellia bacterium]|nr:hypothetical protein [Blastocatellia bacterium]MCS7158580.1 hypothetical protein [Blastocatellia bacterium]MDW8169294.1 hypothetical protein [Acidobacteriota bacterium]MDW8257776.1 hypothetical protein [Acidobacteriota bacterium]
MGIFDSAAEPARMNGLSSRGERRERFPWECGVIRCSPEARTGAQGGEAVIRHVRSAVDGKPFHRDEVAIGDIERDVVRVTGFV